jgi:hypothetical protein
MSVPFGRRTLGCKRILHNSYQLDMASGNTLARRTIFPIICFLCSSCTLFYDEGARFADQVANRAREFRSSNANDTVFEYIPLYGADQRVRVGIGRMRWCPNPPCDGSWNETLPSGERRWIYQGAATVWVERGKSGTGYRIAAEASVPRPLELEKRGGPIRVHMRKVNGPNVLVEPGVPETATVVEIVGLD